SRLYDFKGASWNGLHLVQIVVIPAGVRGSGDEPVRAIVRYKHSVLLQRRQNDFRSAGEAGKVIASLESHSQTHRWCVWIGVAAGVVSGGVDVGSLRGLHCETHRML